MEPVHDPYKNSLDDVLDSDIDDTVASTIDTNLCPLRQSMLATQSGMLFGIPLSSGLFGETASSRDKNSSLSTKKSSSLTLPASIIPKEPSNPLLRPIGNYGKLRKGKLRVALKSWGLENLGYIMDQSGSQGTSTVNKSNDDGTENSWRNRMQKGSSVVREQKRNIRSDVSQEKLKQESSIVDNLIHDDSDLILVGN